MASSSQAASSPRPTVAPVEEAVRSLKERGVVCWDHLIPKGCAGCTLLHICAADGTPACGRHVTDTLCLWGRRRRPPCAGDCDRAHLPLAELVRAVEAGAARCGQRLHMRRHEAAALPRWTALLGHAAPTSTAPAASEQSAVAHAVGDDLLGGGGGGGGGEWSFHVVPQAISDGEVAEVLALRRPSGSLQLVGKVTPAEPQLALLVPSGLLCGLLSAFGRSQVVSTTVVSARCLRHTPVPVRSRSRPSHPGCAWRSTSRTTPRCRRASGDL